jgi:hypothetical protein
MGNVYTPILTELFNEGIQNPLPSPNWSTPGASGLQIISGDLCADAGTIGLSTGIERFIGASVPGDQYVEVTIGPSFNGAGYITLRSSNSNNNVLGGYWLNINGNLSNTLTLFNPSGVQIGSATDHATLENGDVIHFESVGSNFLVSHNGTVLINTTDSSQSTGTVWLGLAAHSSVSDTTFSKVVIGSVTQGNPPVITSPAAASGATGTSFSYTITGTNIPTSFGATGLPLGLSVNTSTGVISGTPQTSGTVTIGLSATNASGTGNQNLTLMISSGPVTSFPQQGEAVSAANERLTPNTLNGNPVVHASPGQNRGDRVITP